MSKRLIAEEVVQMMNLLHYDRSKTASNQKQFKVIEEQSPKIKTSEVKAKVKKKGSDDWKLVVRKDAQFDPKNLKADDVAFIVIKNNKKVKEHVQKIKKQYPDFTLGPENIILSNQDKFWTGKKTDRYIFMIDPTPTRERIEKMKTILVKKVETIENKNDQPKPILPQPTVETQEQIKVWNLPGDNTWEYAVVDGNWRARKQVPGTGDWTTGTKEDGVFDLKDNKEASAKLDKEHREAREAQETLATTLPEKEVLSKEQQNELAQDVKFLTTEIGSVFSMVDVGEMQKAEKVIKKWNDAGFICELLTQYKTIEGDTLMDDLDEIVGTDVDPKRTQPSAQRSVAFKAIVAIIKAAKCDESLKKINNLLPIAAEIGTETYQRDQLGIGPKY